MPLRDLHIFTDCNWSWEDVKDGTGQVIGKNLVIFDDKEKEVWKLPLSLDSAKRLGQRAMSIGAVDSPPVDMARELHRRGGKAS